MKNNIPYPPYLKDLAKSLRKNMTFSEVILWKKLRDYSMMCYDFHRQKPLLNFIADFYCKELNLVIEIDGITHHEKTVQERDLMKEKELGKYGISVIRFSARQIICDIENVLRAIQFYIEDFEEKYGVSEKILKRRRSKNMSG